MRRPTVLIVEDEALVATELELFLEDNGFDVSGWAMDCAGALEIVEGRVPECAVVDIQLRGGDDGIALARLLNDRFGIGILFLTAQSDAATMARAAAVRHHAYIRKPYDPARLLEALRASVGEPPPAP